ncbi:MAG TPA: 16S rRNA (guanine(527)-N(7))-methyltransferase RsmG [Clostridiales bacterium]|nr:16S rRNA (guanine(527)-N(7))-methyltransferase RsmG [Clostridiales bacterium]
MTTERAEKIIQTAVGETGAVIENECIYLIRKYFAFLLDWNKKVNLISRKSEEEVLETALVESYSLYELIKDDPGKFLDVGSGGGLPGLIISILMREAQVELLDSIRKKTVFLEEAVSHLELKNVKVINKRLEDIDKNSRYDIIFSRGVGNFAGLKKHYFAHIGNSGRIVILTGTDNAHHFRNYDIIENPFLEGRIIANMEK